MMLIVWVGVIVAGEVNWKVKSGKPMAPDVGVL
jgi:hypothetical protein